MKAKCSASCGREFTLNALTVAELENEVEKIYFTCPHCGKEYLCFYTDPEIRELHEQIRSVDSFAKKLKPGTRTYAQGFDAATKRHEKLKQKITEKMNALRERIEGQGDADGTEN